jgi:polysaccharide pyruvyl transferase WcaK-like protein
MMTSTSIADNVKSSKVMKIMKIIVLGFYDRHNLGDEMFKVVIGRLLASESTTVQFVCTDDVTVIPEGTDVVVVGGGDVITGYFMAKIRRLLADFTGKVYALSVGIPYVDEKAHLTLFDHVFVRSKGDRAIAVAELGDRNVTYLPDATWMLKTRARNPVKCVDKSRHRVGICLANTMFAASPRRGALLATLCEALKRYAEQRPGVEYHLISFNTHEKSRNECDYYINRDIADCLNALMRFMPPKTLTVKYEERCLSMTEMLDSFQTMDLILCGRYHSIMCAVIEGKPFVALSNTPKVARLLSDLSLTQYNVTLKTDEKEHIMDFDGVELLQRMRARDKDEKVPEFKHSPDFAQVYRTIVVERKSRWLLDHGETTVTCDRARSMVLRILQSEFPLEGDCVAMYCGKGRIPVPQACDYIELSVKLCLCITKRMNTPYVYGLGENMQTDDFCMEDAVNYIVGEEEAGAVEGAENASGDESNSETNDHTYFPQVHLGRRLAWFDVDDSFSNNFKQYHRFGWTSALAGLANLSASRFGRRSHLILDCYADRTFHWARPTLQSMRLLPYTADWMGVVHHTFDQTQSEYNCVRLFKSKTFLASLDACKGLISLSRSHAAAMRRSLDEVGHSQIPVAAIPHPMQQGTMPFDWLRFRRNKDKKVVQVGAFLRDSFAIYELALRQGSAFRKVALKGTDMHNYFRPPDFFADLRSAFKGETAVQQSMEDVVSMVSRDSCHKIQDANISRGHCQVDNTPPKIHTRTIFQSKYCQSIYNMLERMDDSVTVMERISNDEYDHLLSQNVVFLRLVDCSAVNTVMECIMNNTVLLVNRLPPLEEVLGEGYPGFYDDLGHAADILDSDLTLEDIHIYLTNLDKSHFDLSYFVDCVQRFIATSSLSIDVAVVDYTKEPSIVQTSTQYMDTVDNVKTLNKESKPMRDKLSMSLDFHYTKRQHDTT